MTQMVSVIISDLFEQRLPETIDNLHETADGPIEIIVKQDHDTKGMRHHLNEAANEAKGQYLFKIDGHCIMSPHWDTLMKEVCQPNDMVVSRIREIDNKTWTVRDKGFSFVKINHDLTIVECGDFVRGDRQVAETMASIGCGWLVHKARFDELEQNWEQLGRFGNLGVEWALKIWLSGGRVLVHREVICGHLFRHGGVMMGANAHANARKLLGSRFAAMKGPQQVYPLNWLGQRFQKAMSQNTNKSKLVNLEMK